MKKLILLALALPSLASAQTLGDRAAELRDAALNGDTVAWDILEGLTTEVGQRLAGTEAEARARDWAVRRLTALGFANVHVEPFDMPVWVRGEERAEIVSPFPQRLVADRARQFAARRRRRGSRPRWSASTASPRWRRRPTRRCAAGSSSSTII